MSADVVDGTSCKPNISAAGIRRRRMSGYVSSAIGVAALGVLIATGIPWYWRLLLFLPAMAAATGFLQAARNTCAGRAREGTFENNDFTTVKMDDADVLASRKVARGIVRDSVVIGLACAAAAAATGFIG